MEVYQLIELITAFFYSIVEIFVISKSSEVGFDHSPTPRLIDADIYNNLFTYAHLIDISYCISSISGIKQPFECDLGCESRFPNVTLVYQWYYDDSVTGYIATTYSNIFNYNETSLDGGTINRKKKTIIVSLRGTRSIFDSYTDIKVDMTSYINLNIHLPKCGAYCKVHQGFYDYYLHTLVNIHRILDKELVDTPEDYELLIVGHSMGGSVGLLLALHYLDLGFDKLSLITMGQPLVGNKEFVNWVDLVMGSSIPPIHNSFERKYFRVVHKDDIVTTIPNSDGLLNQYSQFNNQIYLNCSSSTSVPFPPQVVDCVFGDNSKCIKRDFQGIRLIDYMSKDYFRSHNTYFRRLGMCGMKIK